MQALSSIDFNDTFQVVSNKKAAKSDHMFSSNNSSEGSGDATGSTDYEVIQQADDQDASRGDLNILKEESGNTIHNRGHHVGLKH